MLTAKERHFRLVLQHGLLDGVDLLATNVGRVTNNQVDWLATGGQCLQEVAGEKTNAVSDIMFGGVGSGNFQSVRRNIGCRDDR